MIVILGAGLTGLSCSYHLGHDRCVLLEKNHHPFGHIHTEFREGFTWDEGPHVSFTVNEYVRELFARSVQGEFEEYPVRAVNYYRGHWIDHPAQSNLFQVPEPLRSRCVQDFLAGREHELTASRPENYQQWLDQTFGAAFAETFPAAYTRKYWTVPPKELTTAWVGKRVFRPEIRDVIAGSRGPLPEQTHYIKTVRYPRRGGYQAFARLLLEAANVHLSKVVASVDLLDRQVTTADGAVWPFEKLINTLPLPVFIRCCRNVPSRVREAADALSCSQLLLINLAAPHPTRREGNWFYIYDEDKLSTRINYTEKLSPENAPSGCSGVQVEVYASKEKPFSSTAGKIASRVERELVEMGLVDEASITTRTTRTHTRSVPWANVIFDHAREPALQIILEWLEEFGLVREEDDLAPMCDWSQARPVSTGAVCLAGRFGQWKYFWTDDCVLRGRSLAQ